MCSKHLREFCATLTNKQLREWVEKQAAMAKGLCARLRNRTGAPAAEIPKPDEVVNETIVRILAAHSEKYVWDGTGTFEAFFRRCMVTSMGGLRSGERRHRTAANKFVPFTDTFTGAALPNALESVEKQDDEIAKQEAKRLLASMIVKTRMGTPLRGYIQRLPDYASQKMTVEEIAVDLNVKPGSIDPYRGRARRILLKKDKGDD